MDFLDNFKATAMEGYIKNKFGAYLQDGQISVELDTSNHNCSVKATLVGESQPISIDIKKYEVRSTDAGKFLVITDVCSDRKWVDTALNNYLKNRVLKVPSFVASAI